MDPDVLNNSFKKKKVLNIFIICNTLDSCVSRVSIILIYIISE